MKQTEHDINLYIDDIAIMTAEKARLGAELGVAARIQSDMLPTRFPKREDFSVYALMSPAKEVGGDFYDFFMIDPDHIGLVMADVSGKGVPASLFMVITKTLIKNHELIGGTPAEVLADVNEQLCENNAAALFVTVWFGILDLHESKLISANAGHEYPAVMHKGGKYELIVNEHCPPLASMEGLEFENECITLSHGDRLFLYTDGVTEAKDTHRESATAQTGCLPRSIPTISKTRASSCSGQMRTSTILQAMPTPSTISPCSECITTDTFTA